jgi:hypothetical protein
MNSRFMDEIQRSRVFLVTADANVKAGRKEKALTDWAKAEEAYREAEAASKAAECTVRGGSLSGPEHQQLADLWADLGRIRESACALDT